jgi:hypothetical protein
MIPSLSIALQKQARAKLMLEHYGHLEESQLSPEAKTFIAMQPSVTRAAPLTYRGAVTGVHGSEMLNAVQLKAAHTNLSFAVSTRQMM